MKNKEITIDCKVRGTKCDYENPWLFDGAPFLDSDIKDSLGFVYEITNKITGHIYLGRKYFYSTRKPTRTAKRRKTTPSDWKNYYGSSKDFLTEIAEYGIMNFQRRIISIHKTRGDTNMNEVRLQFIRNVLEDDKYVNRNIAGKYHRTPQHIIDARRIEKLK